MEKAWRGRSELATLALSPSLSEKKKKKKKDHRLTQVSGGLRAIVVPLGKQRWAAARPDDGKEGSSNSGNSSGNSGSSSSSSNVDDCWSQRPAGTSECCCRIPFLVRACVCVSDPTPGLPDLVPARSNHWKGAPSQDWNSWRAVSEVTSPETLELALLDSSPTDRHFSPVN